MKISRVIILALVISPLTCLSADINECTDRPECWPEGSAMHSGLLYLNTLKTSEAQLNDKHEELVNLVSSARTPDKVRIDERLLNALKSQQVAWRKYVTEECELVGSLTGGAGSWQSTYATKCVANHTELRLRRVRSAVRCIEKISENERWLDQNRCLQQLAPLTNSK